MIGKARMVNALTSTIKQTATTTKLLKKYEKAAVVCFSHFLNNFMT